MSLELQQHKCKCCTAPLNMANASNGVITCGYCGEVFTVAKSQDPAAVDAIRTGQHELDICKFDDAYESFGKASKLDPEEAESYMGMALAYYKVQHVRDEVKGRLQPICHEIDDSEFTKDKNYRKALTLATEEQREQYVRQGKEIDYIRQEFYKLKKSGLDYDCFICVKVTDDETHTKTFDYKTADDLYFHLRGKGYKPFFSEREIGSRTGADYEALILYALYTSECMLVVCSNESYLQTPWVKNEYVRFLKMVVDEEKESDSITIVFHGKAIEKLPTRKGKLQGIDSSKGDAYEKVVAFVDKHTPEAKKRREDEKRRKAAEEAERKRKLDEQERAIDSKLKMLEDLQKKIEADLRQKQEQAEKEKNIASPQVKPTTKSTASPSSDFGIENGVLMRYVGEDDKVVIPDGVTSIGEAVFANCEDMISVTIPNSVTDIGERAFESCICLESITIPDSVTRIGKDAFWGCDYITSVTIPDSVTQIGESAFSACDRLTGIKLAGHNQKYSTSGGVLFNKAKTELLCYPSGRVAKEYIVPSSVTSIKSGAFSCCENLLNVTVPNSVTSIEDEAFDYCSALKKVTLPHRFKDRIKSIFGDTKAQFVFLDDAPNAATTEQTAKPTASPLSDFVIENGVLKEYKGKGGDVVIPDGVTGIGESAFERCDYITSVVIPDGVTSIGYAAFNGCNKLINVTIPSSVTSMAEYAFNACGNLKSIEIPSGITSLENNVFSYCYSITSVKIPNGVTSIGNAFHGCESLTSITIPNGVTSIGNYAFPDCISMASITVENGNKKYHSAGNCIIETASKTLIVGCKNSIIPDDNSVTSIGSHAFAWCKRLTNISIPNSVTNIEESAFNGCENLTSITIPSSVTSIGNEAFSRCRGVTNITVASGNKKYHSVGNCIIETASKTLIAGCKSSVIPNDNSVTSIGRNAFTGCGLTNVEIPNSVTRIGNNAFESCGSLTSITIPNGVTSIGIGSFWWCSNLTSIEIPDSVTSIEYGAFYNCRNLTAITIPRRVTSIGENAFNGCGSLTSIEIPNSVTSIGKEAFACCSGLQRVALPQRYKNEIQSVFGDTEAQFIFSDASPLSDFDIENGVLKEYKGKGGDVTVPDGVTSIGGNAFYECENLESIAMPNSVTRIEYNAFYSCMSLYKVTLPTGLHYIGGSAFCKCHSLENIALPNGLKEIDSYAFNFCSGLTSISIPKTVQKIGGSAFESCFELKTVTIPQKFKSKLRKIFGKECQHIQFTFT